MGLNFDDVRPSDEPCLVEGLNLYPFLADPDVKTKDPAADRNQKRNQNQMKLDWSESSRREERGNHQEEGDSDPKRRKRFVATPRQRHFSHWLLPRLQ